MTQVIYPGTFDPPTNGHLDLIRKGSRIFDHVLVAVTNNPGKKPLFTIEERLEMLREITRPFRNVSVEFFDGLLVEFAKAKKIPLILRGIRTPSDFEYERQMALTNRTLAPEVETIFINTHEDYSFVSSSMVKQAAMLGGDVSALVPPEVARRLAEKFKNPPPPAP
jgi:pantetheine-phosphate adenylyltransferase